MMIENEYYICFCSYFINYESSIQPPGVTFTSKYLVPRIFLLPCHELFPTFTLPLRNLPLTMEAPSAGEAAREVGEDIGAVNEGYVERSSMGYFYIFLFEGLIYYFLKFYCTLQFMDTVLVCAKVKKVPLNLSTSRN